jgi:signal peptidase I
MQIEWKKVLYSTYEIVSMLFLLSIAILGTFALYSKFSHSSNFKLLSVVSGSMSPEIPVGSAVLVNKQNDYFVNDVVTYKLGSNLVTHRVFYAGNYFLTKGDANESVDQKTVDKNDIIGKVVFSAPYLGYFQESTKSTSGLVGLILIPSLLIIVHESFIVIKEIRKVKFDFNFLKKNSNIAIGIMIVGLLMWSSSDVLAYFTDTDSDLSINISTASLASPSPSPTLSPTPTASPTTTPSPTATPSASPTATPTIAPTVTPTASPSLTPAPSGTPVPTVLPSACPTTGAVNCGNGAGSNNTVIIENNSSTIINQQNSSNSSTVITVNSQTGNNVGNGNSSNTQINTGNSNISVYTGNIVNSNTVTQ